MRGGIDGARTGERIGAHQRWGQLVERLCGGTKIGGEHHGAVEEGDHIGVIGHRLRAQRHRQGERHAVAFAPRTIDHRIAVAPLETRGNAIDRNRRTFAPAGQSDRQRAVERRREGASAS